MSDNPTGSCLCKSVQYVVNAPFRMAVNCHCKTCKKITGAAFEAIALVEEGALAITCGREMLTAYAIGELATKYFCRQCGTPIYNLHTKVPGQALIHIGSLDDPTMVSPSANLFCESMLPWVPGIGQVKSYERGFGS